jgi:hypothetical protein
LIVDCRKRRTAGKGGPSTLIDGAVVEQVESFMLLSLHITNEVTLSKDTKTVVKRARQNLFVRLSTSLGPNFLPSRISIPGGVRGRP